MVRNEALLQQGLAHLRRIKEKARDGLMARNSHELWRSLEVMNMIDLGELVFVLALDRRETRGLHRRPDYPFTDPTLDRAHVVRWVEGAPQTGWRSYQGGR
jgi:succinate dehydrogenase/fumarate reductase flavoprotein subunit